MTTEEVGSVHVCEPHTHIIRGSIAQHNFALIMKKEALSYWYNKNIGNNCMGYVAGRGV